MRHTAQLEQNQQYYIGDGVFCQAFLSKLNIKYVFFIKLLPTFQKMSKNTLFDIYISLNSRFSH